MHRTTRQLTAVAEDQLESVLREAQYYESIRHPSGWRLVDEDSGGLAPGAVWSLSCSDPYMRRFATMAIAASLAGCRERTAVISTVGAAWATMLEIVARPCRINPTALAVAPQQVSALSRWVLDDRWHLLDLDTYGAGDTLNQVLASPRGPVRSLVIDRADLLSRHDLTTLLPEHHRPDLSESTPAALARYARATRTRLVLSYPSGDQPANERDDASLTIMPGPERTWEMHLRTNCDLQETSYEISMIGQTWRLDRRSPTPNTTPARPHVQSLLADDTIAALHTPEHIRDQRATNPGPSAH